MQQNLNKPSKDLLLELINIANGTSFVMADLDFAAPVVAADDAPANTLMTVTATETNAFQGVKLFHYNRLDLGLMYNGLILELEDSEAITTVMDVVAILNQRYQTAISTDDVVDGPITKQSDGSTPVTITAKAGSFVYQGSVTWQLVGTATPPESDVVYDGFFLINDTHAMFSNDLVTVTEASDNDDMMRDFMSGEHAVITGGYANELYILKNFAQEDGTDSIRLYMTHDKGLNSGEIQLYNQRIVTFPTPALFFKGVAYYIAQDTTTNANYLYRLVNGGEGPYDMRAEAVMELRGFYNSIAATDDQLCLCDGSDLHLSSDGVTWERLDAPYWLDSVTAYKGEFGGLGYTDTGAIWWRRDTSGMYHSSPMVIPQFPGLADNTAYPMYITYQTTLAGELFVLMDIAVVDEDSNEEHFYGLVLKSDAFFGPWNQVMDTDMGFDAGSRFAYSSPHLGILSIHDGRDMTGIGPNWMAYSGDEGDTWTYRDQSDTPYGVDDLSPTTALGLFYRLGEMPTVPALPTHVGAFLTPQPSQANSPLLQMEIEPDDSIVVLGDYLSLINGSQFSEGGDKVYGLAALKPDGQLDMLRNITVCNSVSSFARLPNGQYLISAATYDLTSREFESGDEPSVLLRLNDDFTLDRSYVQIPANTIYTNGFYRPTAQCIAVYPDGRYLIASNISTINGVEHQGLIRFLADDTIDPDFTSPYQASSQIFLYKVFVLPSGRIVSWGSGNTPLGPNRPLLMEADGSLVANFPDLGDGTQVTAVHEFDANTLILFVVSNVDSALRAVKIRADGWRDESWNLASEWPVRCVFPLSETQLLVSPGSGDDTYYPLHVMDIDGTLTPHSTALSFIYGPNVLGQQSTGHMVAAGSFYEVKTKRYPMIGTTGRYNLVRWSDTELEETFDPALYDASSNINIGSPFIFGEGVFSSGFRHYEDRRFYSAAANGDTIVAGRFVYDGGESGLQAVASDRDVFPGGDGWGIEVGVGVRGNKVRFRSFNVVVTIGSDTAVLPLTGIDDGNSVTYQLMNPNNSDRHFGAYAYAMDNSSSEFSRDESAVVWYLDGLQLVQDLLGSYEGPTTASGYPQVPVTVSLEVNGVEQLSFSMEWGGGSGGIVADPPVQIKGVNG